MSRLGFAEHLPYAALSTHGMVGDRRTAALVAADGTVDWMCLPDFDGPAVFSSLIDAKRGGFFRMGPVARIRGRQSYRSQTATLITTWRTSDWGLELADTVLWPEWPRSRDREHHRVLIRVLRCVRGTVDCCIDLQARPNHELAAFRNHEKAAVSVRLWTNSNMNLGIDSTRAQFTLNAGAELVAILAMADDPRRLADTWRSEVAATERWWSDYLHRFRNGHSRTGSIVRAIAVTQLLVYAPSGAIVAAPTTSLPERICGDRNYDYRFSWLRDASLVIAMLSRMNELDTPARFLDWICTLGTSTEAPLQVVYGIRGETELPERELDLYGYRGTSPVKVGNRAYRQRQIGALGYLLDGLWNYVRCGGVWKNEYDRLVLEAARHTCEVWPQPDSGIWELQRHAQYTSSKVMCWVILDRAIRIACRLGDRFQDFLGPWKALRETIREGIVKRGWNDEIASFSQRFEARNVDAAELLIAVMELAPGNDRRLGSTVDRIANELGANGFLYRFDPRETPGEESLPLGEFEGAFLPATCWLATSYAKMGRFAQAEAIVQEIERAAGQVGLLSEEIDARDGQLLGNYPLLFAHAEFIRALLELDGR